MIKVSISKSADLRLHLPENLPAIEADPIQLRQVLMNLVINASEALENQPGTIDISAGVVDGSSLAAVQLWPSEPMRPIPHLCIEVADSGAGIRPEVLKNIFDPFFSTKFTGRGLGLPAVLGIMRGHNGAIRVESAPGKGSAFRVYFPLGTEASKAGSAGSTSAPAAPPRNRSGLILLVDDEPSLRETASKLLARMGFQVTCAADGEQAVHLFRTQASRIAGVILDLTMPQLDGVQALARIREIRADIPVIVSSGYSEQDVMQRFEGLQVNGFISKPYTLEGLRAALDRVLPA
jgi:two-component system, cell cycle sensor histidine kinase and response regulator CckA